MVYSVVDFFDGDGISGDMFFYNIDEFYVIEGYYDNINVSIDFLFDRVYVVCFLWV